MRVGCRSGVTVLSGVVLAGSILLFAGCPNPFLKRVQGSVAPPAFSPGGGVFGTDQAVSLTSLSGESIYYTTDGSTPNSSSAQYSGPISVAGNGTVETIEAIAVKGGSASAVVSASFTIDYSVGGTSTLATPTFSPVGGDAPNNQLITLSGPSGASVYYTTNGSTPSASAGTLYSAPFAISGSNGTDVTIRAVSVESGYISSTVVSAGFVITYSADSVVPSITINVPSGGFLSTDGTHLSWVSGAPPSFTLSGGTSSTTYYYVVSYDNLAPGAPTTASSSASGPSATVTLSPPSSGFHTVTIEAMAEDPSTTPGPLSKASWYLNEPVAAPSATVSSGRYGADQSVTFSDATSGATISLSGTSTDYLSGGSAWAGGSISAGPGTTESLSAIGPLGGYVVTATAGLQGWVSTSLAETYYIVYPKITLTASENLTIPGIPSSFPGGSIQSLLVKLWGAGGGGGWGNLAAGGPGGGGGFAETSISTGSGQSYQIGVGQGGAGSNWGSGSNLGGGGGGMTYLLSGSTYYAIAGGGGGGGEGYNGGGGIGGSGGGGGIPGGIIGDGGTGGAAGNGGAGGSGGTSSSGNPSGNPGQSISAGGSGGASAYNPSYYYSGAGGAGYGGGGSGGLGTSSDGAGGGGGGNLGSIIEPGSGQSPGDPSDSDLLSGYAGGGTGGSGSSTSNGSSGGNGLAVIYVD